MIDRMIATRYERLQAEMSAAGSKAVEVCFKEANLCSTIVNCARSRVTRLVVVTPLGPSKCHSLGTASPAAGEDPRQWTENMVKRKGTKEVPRKATPHATVMGSRATLPHTMTRKTIVVVGMQDHTSLEP